MDNCSDALGLYFGRNYSIFFYGLFKNLFQMSKEKILDSITEGVHHPNFRNELLKAMDAYHLEQSKPLVDCLQEIVNKIEDLSLHFRFNSNIKKAKEALKRYK